MPPKKLAPQPQKTASGLAAKSQAGIQSVEVGFALLEALIRTPSAMMLRDLAQEAGMSPAKAHRYLVSYQRLGLVAQDSGARYDLGPAALKLGLAALERIDAVQLARSHMDALMAEIGHTVAIAVWGNHGPVIVHWQEPARAVTVNLRLGDVMPLLSSATGRCFCAFMPFAQIQPFLTAELAHLSKAARSDLPSSLTAAKAMMNETREHGLGRVTGSLLPGINGLAAPVWDASEHMCLSLVSLGASASFDASYEGAIANSLRRQAARLSAQLGSKRCG
jgi:DNA-binding IclR family transcriptional regulator